MYQRLHDLCDVQVCERPSFAQWRSAKGKLGKGIRYEAAWHVEAAKRFGDLYVPGVWFKYRRTSSPSVWSYAQTDGILFDFEKGLVTVFELKFKHTIEAYFQLIDRYIPLVDYWLHAETPGLWRIAPIEVCFWYDRALAYPTKVRLQADPLAAKPGEFSVHVWKNDR